MGGNPARNFFGHFKDFLISEDIYQPLGIGYYKGDDLDTFVPKLAWVAAQRKLDPDSILYVMRKESRLNPQAQSGLKSGSPFDSTKATGLLQWEPSTAQGMGTTTQALYNMSGTDQLDYVNKYFHNVQKTYGPNSMNDIASVYLGVFYPYALGQQMNFVLGSESSDPNYPATVAADNPSFDIGNKGYIVKADMWSFIAQNAFKP